MILLKHAGEYAVRIAYHVYWNVRIWHYNAGIWYPRASIIKAPDLMTNCIAMKFGYDKIVSVYFIIIPGIWQYAVGISH